jgi:hypothetical protein
MTAEEKNQLKQDLLTELKNEIAARPELRSDERARLKEELREEVIADLKKEITVEVNREVAALPGLRVDEQAQLRQQLRQAEDLMQQLIAELKKQGAAEGGLTDQDKAVYAEAGHWVRMVNTVTWTLMLAVAPALIGLIVAAHTSTTIPKWIFAVGSGIIALLWLYFDYLYEVSANKARAFLSGIEQTKNFGHKLYDQQQKIVPSIYSINIISLCLVVVLVLAWFFFW